MEEAASTGTLGGGRCFKHRYTTWWRPGDLGTNQTPLRLSPLKTSKVLELSCEGVVIPRDDLESAQVEL